MKTHLQLRLSGSRMLGIVGALSLAAWGTVSVNAQNVLLNPDLDQIGFTTQANPCPIGWVVNAFKTISGGYTDGGDSEPWCNVQQANGYGFFFKPFSGDVSVGDLVSVWLYQDNAATPGTKFTLSGYASCEANYSGLFATNSPNPVTAFFVEFLDASDNPIVTNVFNLITDGLDTSGPGGMSLHTTLQYTAPAGTAKVRAGAEILNCYSTTGAQSFFVDAFDLESVAPPGSPVITNQPSSVTVAPNGSAVFSVAVSNTAGVSYQWQANNANVSGPEFSGGNTATLTVSPATTNDVAHYRCVVSNSSGTVYTTSAALAIQSIAFYPTVVLSGKVGDTYRIDYTTILSPPTWIPLSTNTLTMSPQLFIDSSSPNSNTRFYRSVFLY